MPDGWEWDQTLYAGSAEFYEQGRLPYPASLGDATQAALGLDGSGRLIDVGCGPGIIAHRLAHLFAHVVGVDADVAMLEIAALGSSDRGITNTSWVHMLAEDLPADLGTFTIGTFGQSFHWMDRERVAERVFAMLQPGGALVHVHHFSIVGDEAPTSRYPLPPYDEISQLVETFIGSARRAGQGTLPHGTPDGEAAVLGSAGYEGPEEVALPGGEVVLTSVDDIVARTFSTSRSAPHLFGDRRDEFEAALVELLNRSCHEGRFAERVRDAAIVIWRKPDGG